MRESGLWDVGHKHRYHYAKQWEGDIHQEVDCRV